MLDSIHLMTKILLNSIIGMKMSRFFFFFLGGGGVGGVISTLTHSQTGHHVKWGTLVQEGTFPSETLFIKL